MTSIVAQGFALGLAYSMPIGAQNLFVINASARGTLAQAHRTALVFAAMDISLAIACILGIAKLTQFHDSVRLLVTALAVVFLFFFGWRLTRSSASDLGGHQSGLEGSMWKAAFLLTWCNPHALADGSLLLGGYQSILSAQETFFFAIGLITASAFWFFFLSTFINSFRRIITPRHITIVNRVCGIALILFGVRLAISFLKGM